LFIFYDTETTGTIRDFDQILQFAAILTDDELNELDRFEIRCRCLPWVLPAPMALWVTGIHPAQLSDPALPSFYEMMGAIRERLEAWSPATFIGYNSIGFDEPLLQRAFWQTLHPPYLTVTNGNARMDLLPIVQAASHLAEGVLSYPKTPTGRTGFKLDQLAPLNGFAHENAHDALADVEATIHIARIIKRDVPALWDHVAQLAPKREAALILAQDAPVLMVEYFMSGPSVWWGQRIDSEGRAASKAKCVRLDQNWRELAGLDDGDLAKALTKSPKPLREIALNKAPIVYSLQQAQGYWGMSPSQEQLEQAGFLSQSPELLTRLVELAEAFEEDWPDSEHLEQRIFEGFPGRSDERLIAQFHSAADWTERAELMRGFEDARYRQLAQRLVFAEAPEHLSVKDRARLNAAITERFLDDHGDKELWRSLPTAVRELNEMKARDQGSALSQAIETWINEIAKSYGSA
jgi:exodeoxyribonuclease-1